MTLPACPSSLLAAYKHGLTVTLSRGKLKVDRCDSLPRRTLDPILDGLKADKPAIIAFLRGSALHDLAELVREHGLRFRRLAEWGVLVPEYPGSWTAEDREYANNLLMAAAPLSDEELNGLMPRKIQSTWRKQ